MPDYVRRAIRTFLQAFLGVFLSSYITMTGSSVAILDLEILGRLLVSATIAGIIAMLTFAQNLLEDTTNMPSILKNSPSRGKNPVTTDPTR